MPNESESPKDDSKELRNDVDSAPCPSRCSTCDGGGWMWPNLGVNCPAGAAWAVSSAQAMAIQHGHTYYIQCQSCNSGGHKPHPDQEKIDAAKEIGEIGQRSPWNHALMFDGSSLVDTWDANQRNPRKYRFRP